MLQREMANSLDSDSRLSDRELLAEVRIAAAREREATARLIALLAQLDERRLYLGEGCSSLFTLLHAGAAPLGARSLRADRSGKRSAAGVPRVLDLLDDGVGDADDDHAPVGSPDCRQPSSTC